MRTSKSVLPRHGRSARQLELGGAPRQWISEPGQFKSPWDYAEHVKIHEADRNASALHALSHAKLREKFFPRLAAKRLSLLHTKAAPVDPPGALATSLLFFDTLLLETCPLCLTSETIPIVSSLLEKGLAVPRLVTGYFAFEGKAFDLLETHQEGIVSTWANQAFLHAALIGAPFKKWNQRNQGFIRRLEKVRSNSKSFPRRYRNAISIALSEFSVPASPLMMRVAESLERGVNMKDLREIARTTARAQAIDLLETDSAYGTIPTFDVQEYQRLEPAITDLFPDIRPTSMEALDLCAKGLHVAWSPDLPLDEYLGIVSSYRGKLRHLFLADRDPVTAIASATTTVSRVNEELESISRSRRYRWGLVSLNVLKLPFVIGLLSRAALGAGHGLDRLILALASSSLVIPEGAQDHYSEKDISLRDQALARYFSKDIRLVQLWSLRRRLLKTKSGRAAFAKIANLNPS